MDAFLSQCIDYNGVGLVSCGYCEIYSIAMLNIRLAYISTYANVIKLFDTTGRLMLIGVAGDRIPL